MAFRKVVAPVEMTSGEAHLAILAGTAPDRIAARGSLSFRGSDRLVHLPSEIITMNDLDLSGCRNLETMPKRISCRGTIYMAGCKAVRAMPIQIDGGPAVMLDNMVLRPSGPYVVVKAEFPETVLAVLPGRRVGELISHPLLDGRHIAVMTVRQVVPSKGQVGLWLDAADRDMFEPL